MTDHINVTAQRIAELVGEIGRAVQSTDETLTELDHRVSTLRANWNGDAADAYATAQRDWRATMAQLRDLLEQMGTGVERAGEHYGNAEAANLRSWS